MVFGGFENFTLIDYPGKIACVLYTIGCNFRCPYCHNPELVDETVEKTFTERDVLEFLDTRKAMLDGVVITGGEPTMHEDLPAFISEVKKRGFLVKLDSNGTNPRLLKKLGKDRMVDYFAMDIKAPIEKYSKVAARPVDTNAIHESIEVLKNQGVPYEFRTTVIKALHSVEDIRLMASEIRGAQKYYLQKFIPTKLLNPQFRKKVTYTDEEFKELQKIAEEYVEFCGLR